MHDVGVRRLRHMAAIQEVSFGIEHVGVDGAYGELLRVAFLEDAPELPLLVGCGAPGAIVRIADVDRDKEPVEGRDHARIGEHTDRVANAPPQQRPTFILPSSVNRNTGRWCSFASRSASRRSFGQPIPSQRFSRSVGCHCRTRCSTQASPWSAARAPRYRGMSAARRREPPVFVASNSTPVPVDPGRGREDPSESGARRSTGTIPVVIPVRCRGSADLSAGGIPALSECCRRSDKGCTRLEIQGLESDWKD